MELVTNSNKRKKGIMIASIFLLLFGIVFLICGIILLKSEKSFNLNAISGAAIVSGYETSSNSSQLDIRVNVIGIESKTSVLCHSKGIKNRSDFPVGTKVKIKYLEKKSFGVKYYVVKLDEEGFRPANSLNIGKVLAILGGVLLIFSAGCVIILLLGGL